MPSLRAADYAELKLYIRVRGSRHMGTILTSECELCRRRHNAQRKPKRPSRSRWVASATEVLLTGIRTRWQSQNLKCKPDGSHLDKLPRVLHSRGTITPVST